MIVDKDTKAVGWKKSFQQMVLEPLDIAGKTQHKPNKTLPLNLSPYINTHSNWIMDLDIKLQNT